MIRTLLALVGLALGTATAAQTPATPAQETQVDEIDRLRAQLAQPGPDGAEARERAIERLLSLADERAHALLRERLENADDPDSVRLVVLQALKRRFNQAEGAFGLREESLELRNRLLRAYGGTLAIFWTGKVDPDGLLPPDPLREQARSCLVKLPPGELGQGLRAVVTAPDKPLELRQAALRAAADSQNLHLGRLLADFVEDPVPELQAVARAGLRYLTFNDPGFETKAQFEEWFAKLGSRGYQELAEEAGHSVARRARQQREELMKLRRESTAELIAALTERRSGINWAIVQARTLGDDPLTTSACLEQPLRTLAEASYDDKNGGPRLAFARELLQRYRSESNLGMRGPMLEVAAYLCKPTDQEVAPEINAELIAQLRAVPPELQLAALRGLRRFPSPEARAAVVALASAAVDAGEAGDATLTQALKTLGWRGDTPWRAPIDTASDKADWIQLLRRVCFGNFSKERRRAAVDVALITDRENKRVPEVFELLVDIVRDATKEPDFRKSCLIQLQDWSDQEQRADVLVGLQMELFGDGDRDMRLAAAVALSRLPPASDERKRVWGNQIVRALRERLLTEKNQQVLAATIECLVACGREIGQLEGVIGAVNSALDTIGVPVPAEHEFRAKELLAVLPVIAADRRAAADHMWLSACETLLRHEKRPGLRHVLDTHAQSLVRELHGTDPKQAELARKAIHLLLQAALLKPKGESWTATEELRREADDLRQAFDVLKPGDRLPENPEEPRFRLLRLEVLLAGDRYREVTTLAEQYLAEEGRDQPPFDLAQKDAVRLLAADAYLDQNKLTEAADHLARIDPARVCEPRALAVAEQLAAACLRADDPQKAFFWFKFVLGATAEDDPVFRSRFVAKLQAQVRANPQDRTEVLQELDRRAALFDAPDCPAELKEAVAQLRGPRSH